MLIIGSEMLDKELAKYESWEEFKKHNFNLINLLDLKSKKTADRNYQILKSKGVGQTTILKFLGEGKLFLVFLK